MAIKALFALAGMIALHFLFGFIGFTGLLGTAFSILIPLFAWYCFETRHREEDGPVDHAWDIMDLLDLSNILDFVKSRL